MSKYLHEDSQSTENFMVANRNIGVGLTGSVVFSSWYWATEILWVVTMVYSYGIMSSFWYFAGLSVQICVMSLLGIQAKKKIPNGHTCLEIIELRYGKPSHLLYMFMCLVNNLLSASEMILGAAAAISIVSGNLNIVASTMLIPFGVMCYTVVGGLKATFLTDYLHSLVALIILVYFNTAVISSDKIGGISGLYNKVIKHELEQPDSYIQGNYKGSFLTGKSQGAIYFGIINCVGNFGLTVMDSSFWQKAFSANIRASVPGYLIAAALIPAVVWPLGTIVGLANVVLEKESFFPTYPRQMNDNEINNGFGLPYTLMAVLGKKSLGALLLTIYLAVTSTVSAQMIAVSSIISFDIYRQYFNSSATNSQLIKVSHIGVIFFGLFSAGFTVMLHYVGVDMTWMGYFTSMINCPGVVPLTLAILWDRQTKLAAIVSPIVGCIAGLAVWLGTAYKLANLIVGGPTLETSLEGSLEEPSKEKSKEASKEASKDDGIVQITEWPSDDDNNSSTTPSQVKTQRIADFYTKVAAGSVVFVTLVTWVLWPLPLYRDYVFSMAFFTGWTVVAIFWVYLALIMIGLFPLWDGRESLMKVVRGVIGSIADSIARPIARPRPGN
ncbi:hypothetical protein KLMA_30103 [Kluyveromyces marxianus DMKU3-1042]|uniref:Urea active transporter n=1 Tax=Kluyveromyces marxianus (strain DMKU3-1042 / BCC 29191 / NBRC 104275) TaxID=1003335 RepID=W0T8N5_KLUMD|nr:hypothetical protein KLMA_30103 [Kluyveromyces marxianus DMKU3-1042]BAO39398.2 hypothetical protein KLMA_30103 [Kluyveromyces marxianus DMKU3-1042]